MAKFKWIPIFVILFLNFTKNAEQNDKIFSRQLDTNEFNEKEQKMIEAVPKTDSSKRYNMKKMVSEHRSEVFAQGLSTGFDRGLSTGFDRGLSTGFDRGLSTGFDRGLSTGFDRGLSTGFSKGVLESIQTHFPTHFQCAFTAWKQILEEIFKNYQLNPTSTTWKSSALMYPTTSITVSTTVQIPDIPKDILTDILENDLWAYHDIIQKYIVPKMDPNTGKYVRPKEVVLPSKKDIEKQVKYRYKKWYGIITRDDPEAPFFLCLLKTKLQEVRRNNIAFYKKKGDIFERFAAIMAKAYKIACAIHHEYYKYIAYNLEIDDKLPFQGELFRWIPTWSINNETIDYVNLLSYIYFVKHPETPLLVPYTHHTTNEPIPDFPMVKCLNARSEHFKEVVCIPYFISKICDTVDLAKANDLPGQTYPAIWKSDHPLGGFTDPLPASSET